MGRFSEIHAELDQYNDKWIQESAKVQRLNKDLELRDSHIMWLRDKFKDIAAMKDQKKASDFAREVLYEGMATRREH